MAGRGRDECETKVATLGIDHKQELAAPANSASSNSSRMRNFGRITYLKIGRLRQWKPVGSISAI